MDKRKYIAVAVLLGVAALVARASTFPNSYAFNYSASADLTTGANGTLYITTVVTGTTTAPGMPYNILHTPSVTMTVNNGGPGRYQWQGSPAYANMSDSHTVAFDLANMGCNDAVLLSNNGCIGQVQAEILCPVAGNFLTNVKKIQVELADTTVKADLSTKGWNGTFNFYDTHPNCYSNTGPGDNPPDWPGPDVLYDGVDFHTATDAGVRAQDLCWRWASLNANFSGPWACANTPRYAYISYLQVKPAGPDPAVCTFKDNGYNPSF